MQKLTDQLTSARVPLQFILVGKPRFHKSDVVQGSHFRRHLSDSKRSVAFSVVEIVWEGLVAAFCMQHLLADQPSTSVSLCR